MGINLAVTLQGPTRQGWVYEMQYMNYIVHAETPTRMEQMSLKEREEFICLLLNQAFILHRENKLTQRPGETSPVRAPVGPVELDYDYEDYYDEDEYIQDLEERVNEAEEMLEKVLDFLGIHNVDPTLPPD